MDLLNLEYVARDLRALDIHLPAAVTNALALHDAAQASLHSSPADDLRAAFTAGELTVDNIAERLHVAAIDLNARAAAGQLVADLNLPLGKTASAALAADGDRIVKALRRTFDPAAEAIQVAARTVDPDEPPASVLGKGAQAAQQWSDLAGHREQLELCHRIRLALAQCGYGPAQPRVLMYAKALRDRGQLTLAEQALGDDRGPGGRWHRLAALRVPLHLNTAAEAQKVHAAVDQAEADAAQAERDRQAAAAKERNKGWMFPPMPDRTPAA